MIKARASGSKVYLYFMKKGRQARHRIPRNSSLSVWSILSLLFYFLWKILLANSVDPDQMPHYVASDLSRQCLPMTFLRVSR